VSAACVALLRKKVEAILAHPRPGSLQELQGFLGTVNFYRRFLPAAPKLLRPLTDALRGGKAAKERIEWTAEMEEAFSATKQALAKAALLAHPTPGTEVALMVDASGYHVGAALQQRTSAAAAVLTPRSWIPPSAGTQLLTRSCWPALPGSGISGTCWMGGHSPFTRTTNP
jgi:hypothetical protein